MQALADWMMATASTLEDVSDETLAAGRLTFNASDREVA
jgi:hypothetical protein